MPTGSKIFTPCRSLGYVSNHIPLNVRYIKNLKQNLVVTCVGKAFHTYAVSHFSLLSVSGLHSTDISCMCSDSYHVYTACENIIYAWRRGTELKHSYKGHDYPIRLMLPFGCHLISIDDGCILKIWDIKTESLYTELQFDKTVFNISVMMHPATYINKILLGSDSGQMQLWNINKGKMIYSFKGWDAGITCIEQSTAIDIVAVGLETGDIFLQNLKHDETIIKFKQEWGAVKTISFRTDDQPIMATGSAFGHIVFWNLEERRVSSQILAAHDGPVTGMECLPNEPLILTSSPDNTLKLWIFDMPDGGARLLRIREGHSASPGYIRFHGSQNILSAAGDSSLRIFNLQTERFNKSLGKASYNRKASKKHKRNTDPLVMPPIISFTAEPARDKDWDNIAAIHRGLSVTTTWSYDKKKMGNLKLIPERFYKKNLKGAEVAASSICQTQCGNFVLIGYNSGHVDRFNMQSGLWRDSYGDPKSHRLAVRGIAVDALNQIVATGGADDGLIKFYRFNCKGKKHIRQLDVEEPIRFFRFHRDGGVLAACLEDFSIILIDIEIIEVIRKFVGHIGPLTDATFSPDCRWLVTSSSDCSIRTWNIPTGQLVDQFSVEAIPVSIDMSPSGDVLATAHVDYLGIFLWTNKGLYEKLVLKGLTPEDNLPRVDLPQILQDNFEENDNEEVNLSSDTLEYQSPEQIKENLLTLSGLATSRWQHLLNLDVIKERNKPKAPPKVPKNAPFFLPTVTTLNDFDFNVKDNDSRATETGHSKLLIPTKMTNYTAFGKLLKKSITTNDFGEIMERMKTFGPSMIDFEINSLAPDGGGSIEIMLQFLKFIEATLVSRKDFELAESYLSLFLRTHYNLMAENESLRNFLPNLIKCHSDVWNNLEDQIMYCTSIVQFLKTK